jgi:hypothetical protein
MFLTSAARSGGGVTWRRCGASTSVQAAAGTEPELRCSALARAGGRAGGRALSCTASVLGLPGTCAEDCAGIGPY